MKRDKKINPLLHHAQQGAAPWYGTIIAIVLICLLLGVLLTFMWKDQTYTAVSLEAGSPAGMVVGIIAKRGLWLLVVTAGIIAATTWFVDRAAFARLAAGGLGVVAAYFVSKIVKVIVTEQRPCVNLNPNPVLQCPAVPDWSWPSNHATLAAAFALACFFAVPWVGWFTFPVALLVAYARVGAGVHYPHDVFSGLFLGTLMVVIAVWALAEPFTKLALAIGGPGNPGEKKRQRDEE